MFAWRRAIGRLALLAAPVALALPLGCGTSPTAPVTAERSLRVNFWLSSTSGRPGAPITTRVQVRNVGRAPIYYFRSWPKIWEADRHNVEDLCTCPGVMCPLLNVPLPVLLDPGEEFEATRTFEGRLFTCDGPYDVADGEYTVEALVEGHMNDASLTPFLLTRTAVFHWSRQ